MDKNPSLSDQIAEGEQFAKEAKQRIAECKKCEPLIRKDERERILGKMVCVRHYSDMLPEGYDMWELKPSDYLALKGEQK